MKKNNLNGSALAYVGDSFYEHYIRVYLIKKGYTNTNKLHKLATNYTSGINQALIMRYFINNNIITQAELNLYKKGRNVSSSKRKNICLVDYHDSTGFEALIGYLFFANKERAVALIKEAILYTEANYDK